MPNKGPVADRVAVLLPTTSRCCRSSATAIRLLSVVLPFVVMGLLSTLLISSNALAQESWGRFKGEIVVKFLSDGRNVRLEKPFAYVDPNNLDWDVPAGTETDGASVPRFFWIAFPPFTGQYRAAAIVHDYYCQSRTRTWRSTHLAFYTAMRAAGVDWSTAKAMYGAVYFFGPRWGIGVLPRAPGVDKYRTEEQQQAFFNDLKAWIERENPGLDDINRRLDEGGSEIPK